MDAQSDPETTRGAGSLNTIETHEIPKQPEPLRGLQHVLEAEAIILAFFCGIAFAVWANIGGLL